MSSLADPRTLDDLLMYRLSRLLGTGGGMVIRLCEGRFGITRREWRVLALLDRHPGMMSSQLAMRAHLDSARTSRVLTSLAAKRMVVRETGRADRRQVWLTLTPMGQQVVEQLFPLIAQLNRDLLEGLDPAQVRALDAALASMQAQADALVSAAVLPKANRWRGGRARQGVTAAMDADSRP